MEQLHGASKSRMTNQLISVQINRTVPGFAQFSHSQFFSDVWHGVKSQPQAMLIRDCALFTRVNLVRIYHSIWRCLMTLYIAFEVVEQRNEEMKKFVICYLLFVTC